VYNMWNRLKQGANEWEKNKEVWKGISLCVFALLGVGLMVWSALTDPATPENLKKLLAVLLWLAEWVVSALLSVSLAYWFMACFLLVLVWIALCLKRVNDNLALAITCGAQISEVIGELKEAIESAAPTPRPSRTIAAEPGTQLAYVFLTNNILEIGYAPVLSFIEVGASWEPLAILQGEPRVCDCFVERVLMPGESLTDKECAEMKQRYAEAYPAEVQLLEQPREANPSA
jgi:hypothetical protein